MKEISRSFSPFVLAAILLLSVGCSKKPNDAQVSSDVQNKFSQDSGLSDKQLTVQASNGVVTLAGTVDNEAQRDAAARQAASIPGVREVVNNLQVGSSTATAAPPVEPPANVAPPQPKAEPARKSHHTRHTRDQGVVSHHAPVTTDSSRSAPQPPAGDPPPAPETRSAPPPPPPPHKVTVEQGAQLSIRLVDAIDTEKNKLGDTFHATLNSPLSVDGEEVVPAGSDVTGHIVDLKSAGKFAGQSVLVLQLDSIAVGSRTYNIQTDQYKKQGSSRGKNTAEKVGGGAIIGGIIGAIAGGGKGAAIGAAAGGGVGGGVQAATKSQQIKLPSETVLNFTLQAPVTVVKAPNPSSDRPRLGDSQ
jgi:BON domain-containing protein